MSDKIDLAILFPDSNQEDVVLLKSFFIPFGLNVAILPYDQASLKEVIDTKISTVIVYDENNSNFAQNFIIEASIKKIFIHTTFYYLSLSKINNEEQIRLMTLGYSGFLTFPFNATETQNAINIHDCLMKAA